jgi:hypothetical protein
MDQPSAGSLVVAHPIDFQNHFGRLKGAPVERNLLSCVYARVTAISFHPGATVFGRWIDPAVGELPGGGAWELIFFDDAIGRDW